MAMQPVRRIAGQIVQMAPVAALSGLGFSDLAAGAAPSDELDPIGAALPFDPAQEALTAFGSGSASPFPSLIDDDDVPNVTGGACAVAPPPPPVPAPPAPPPPAPRPQVMVVRQVVQADPVVRTVIERQPVVHQHNTSTTVVDDRDTNVSQTIVQTITAGGDVKIDTNLGVASGTGAVVGIGGDTGDTGGADGAAGNTVPAALPGPEPGAENDEELPDNEQPVDSPAGENPSDPPEPDDLQFGTGAGLDTGAGLGTADSPQADPPSADPAGEEYHEPVQNIDEPLHIDDELNPMEEYHEPGQDPQDPQFHVSDLGDDSLTVDD